MRFLVKLYDKTVEWASHKHAARYLAFVSFIDASVFPISPYFMFAPMCLSQPKRGLFYSYIATFSSVLGGFLGYFIGAMVFEPIARPIIDLMGYHAAFDNITQQFQTHSFWAVLVLGMTPLPYKIVAISAGFSHIPLGTFFTASLLGRGLKFILLAIFIRMGLKVIKVVKSAEV